MPTPARAGVVPLNDSIVIEEMFRNAEGNELIPIGSLRRGRLPSAKGKPYPHWYFPVVAEDRHEVEDVIHTSVAHGHEKTFWMAVTLRPDACRESPRWDKQEQRFSATNEKVAAIHALFFDIDVGRSIEESHCTDDQITADEALERLLGLVEEGILPMPSLVARSGRGLYFLYLLDEPLVATPSNVRRWEQVVDLVLPRLARLPPDEGACHTLARWFKAPGSGNFVQYSMLDDGTRALRRYNIDDLDGMLLSTRDDAAVDEPAPEIERVVYEKLVPQRPRRTGDRQRRWEQQAAPMLRRCYELHRLNEHRQGRWPRMRHLLMLYYSTAQKFIEYARLGHDGSATDEVKKNALAATLTFNRTLIDPLPESEIAQMFESFVDKPQTNARIAKDLKVTLEETLALRLESIIPETLRRTRENNETAKRNAKDREAYWFDHFVMNGMPTMCITKITGRDRTTVSRYIKSMEQKGIKVPPRASLRGRKQKTMQRGPVGALFNHWLGMHRLSRAPTQVKDATCVRAKRGHHAELLDVGSERVAPLVGSLIDFGYNRRRA